MALIREACAIGDQALADLTESMLIGRTEREVAQRLEDLLRSHGAEAPAFDTIVAPVPTARAAPPPRGSGAAARGPVTIDFGARTAGTTPT